MVKTSSLEKTQRQQLQSVVQNRFQVSEIEWFQKMKDIENPEKRGVLGRK